MTHIKSFPMWKVKINRVGNFPYIDECVNTDVVFFPVVNKDNTRHIYVYMPTEEIEELITNLQEAVDNNKRVMGIRTQKHIMRWQ